MRWITPIFYRLGLLCMCLAPACTLAQGLKEDDPSLFHFEPSTKMLQGEWQGNEFHEGSLNTTNLTSIKFKDYIYVAWLGGGVSVNVACLGSTHQKELTQGTSVLSPKVYRSENDSQPVYSESSPTMTVYEGKLYIFYNTYPGRAISYLVISQPGTVDIAERGNVPDSPTNLVNLTAMPFPDLDGIMLWGSDVQDNSIQAFVVGKKSQHGRQYSEWQRVYNLDFQQKCIGRVGVCDANDGKTLVAWTGVDTGHQLNTAYISFSFEGPFLIQDIKDIHTHYDHSSDSSPVVFRKDNPEDNDVHIVWKGIFPDEQIWQGVINLKDKNNFKQFAIPTNIGTANTTPALLSLNETVTYMFWPTYEGHGPYNRFHDIMMAKAIDFPYESWMGALVKDEHTLNDLVLPGSNNAGMNDVTQITHDPGFYKKMDIPNFGQCNECGFITQTTDVKGQLEFGYRYFGINLTNWLYSLEYDPRHIFFNDGNKLHTSVRNLDQLTASCLGEGFETLMKQIRDFLQSHPRELVIVNIKDIERGVGLGSIEDELAAILTSYADILYKPKTEKTFADLIHKPIRDFRGKLILTAADATLAEKLGLLKDVFEPSTSSKYRYVDPYNIRIDPLIQNQTNFFKNSTYDGSYKRMDWQIALGFDKVLCDLKPLQACMQNPAPGFWHHLTYLAKCGQDLFKMGQTVYKAFKNPTDPRNYAVMLGWVLSLYETSSLNHVQEANLHLYPTIYDLKQSGAIRKDNKVNIIYTDASDYLYTELCMQLLTDFNSYEEVNPYNGYFKVADTHVGANCQVLNAGSASVSIQGGVAPYKYHWISTGDTTATAKGLNEGHHRVKITDAMGHTVVRQVYVALQANAHSGLAKTTQSKTERQPIGVPNHYEADCDNLIANVADYYSNSANGDSLTATVWVDKTQTNSYVKRHYQFTNTGNVTSANAKITLYFTQQEFDAFNNTNSAFYLPRNPADSAASKNVVILHKRSVSQDVSGNFGSYTGELDEIFPKTTDVTWNSISRRWEITFYTTGLGGYFLGTYDGNQKNEWLAADAYLSSGKPFVQWKVNEKDVKHYYVEYSFDGKYFADAGLLDSKGRGLHTYEFTHQQLPRPLGLDTLGRTVIFYRVRQIFNNGQSTLSKLIPVSFDKNNHLHIYPNPTSNELTIRSSIETRAGIFDMTGKLIQTQTVQKGENTLSTFSWPVGIYIIRTSSGESYKIVKVYE